MARKMRRDRGEVIGSTGDGEPIVREPVPDPVVASPPEPSPVPMPDFPADGVSPAPDAAPAAATGPGTGKRKYTRRKPKEEPAPVAARPELIAFYRNTVQKVCEGIGAALKDPDSFEVNDGMADMIAEPAAALTPGGDLDPRLALVVGCVVVFGSCGQKHMMHRARQKAHVLAPPAARQAPRPVPDAPQGAGTVPDGAPPPPVMREAPSKLAEELAALR